MQNTMEHTHTLRNRIMALRAKIEAYPQAGDLVFRYGQDYYQEETRSIGLHMIREGMLEEGEKTILDYCREHYPDQVETEVRWISKMMRYLNAFTDTLLDNLRGEGYIALQSNTDLPNENALFYPLKTLADARVIDVQIGLRTVIQLDEQTEANQLDGYLYFPSGTALHTIGPHT